LTSDTALDDAATRTRAAEVVTMLADRLRDPARVAATITDPANVDAIPGGGLHCPWHPLSLAEGHAGVALLFAELGHADPAARPVTHAYLRAAGAALVAGDRDGLYQGLPAVAFAARAARGAPGEYERLLAGLDRHVLARAGALMDTLHRREGGVDMRTYDLIGGLAGISVYLLSAGHLDAVAEVLEALVPIAEPIEVGGKALPGWWVWHTPAPGPSGFTPPGHLNLGMAHGVPGLLALLAIATSAGVQVSGQERAMRVMAEWLLAKRIVRDGITWWPSTLGSDTDPADDRVPGRVAWCYGTPGVVRALQLAGLTLGERSWADTAEDCLSGALEQALDPAENAPADSTPIDYSLCHGWAGLLHLLWRVHRDATRSRLGALVPRLARRVLDGFEDQAPFGYRYTARVRVAPERAGFLEGAAGVALALRCFATDTAPASHWDRALLVA
jgi:hypothetical protein